ncbi:MAG TPA: tetratricopeptide repeat protein [Treponemataceae bacterium]|nr:tetratricopeptide repeat protein [Treponemataceae bacterium]
MKKTVLFCCIVFIFSTIQIFAHTSSAATQIRASEKETDKLYAAVLDDADVLIQGLEAYKTGDWNTALFFLRKAVSDPQYSTADTWYVMIMAEMFAGDYTNVLRDANLFIERFSDSVFVSQVQYQKARAYFGMADYNQAIIKFSAFCEKWPQHELYVSALFWTAESLFQLYQFKESKILFNKIVQKYPLSSKRVEAEYRLELLNQREREEKLLYLLRVTGEEYLAIREDYERELAIYESEESIVIRDEFLEMQKQIDDLTIEVAKLQAKNDDLDEKNHLLRTATAEAVDDLKKAARDYQSYFSDSDATASVESGIRDEPSVISVYEGSSALDELLKKAAELEKLLEEQGEK